MTRLEWDVNPHISSGVEKGVLYTDTEAVPWNGLVSVTENDSTTLETIQYFEGQRVKVSEKIGFFNATVAGFTYPDALDDPTGYLANSPRVPFNFTYRETDNQGDKLYLIYNAYFVPKNLAWQSLTDSFQLTDFTWDLYGRNVDVGLAHPSSRFMIDRNYSPGACAMVEDWLYGTDDSEPRFPSPEEVMDLFESAATLKITYHGDGSWTADGPDDMVISNGDGTFEIIASSLITGSSGGFEVSSV